MIKIERKVDGIPNYSWTDLKRSLFRYVGWFCKNRDTWNRLNVVLGVSWITVEFNGAELIRLYKERVEEPDKIRLDPEGMVLALLMYNQFQDVYQVKSDREYRWDSAVSEYRDLMGMGTAQHVPTPPVSRRWKLKKVGFRRPLDNRNIVTEWESLSQKAAENGIKESILREADIDDLCITVEEM